MDYKELEQALENGDTVELCAINQHGEAVRWSKVLTINKAFPLSRFRIIKKSGQIIDPHLHNKLTYEN